MNYLGIDIGKMGAMAMIWDSSPEERGITIRSVPLLASGVVDVVELKKIISDDFYDGSRDAVTVGMENLHAIFGVSASATFSLGHMAGLIEGIVLANGYRYHKILAKEWQGEMFHGFKEIRKPDTVDKNGKVKKGKLDTKAMSIMVAKQLFPNVPLQRTERSKKDDDNIADALLIAEYMRRKNL